MTDDNDEPTGPVKDKLIRTKEQWARDGRGLTGTTADPTKARLPPGQRLTKDFPVLDLGVQPNLNPNDWTLSVAGQVKHPLKWDWKTFNAQPQVTLTNDIHCVTTWSRYENTWVGVPMRALLAAVKPFDTAKFVMLRSYDGYSTNLPLSDIDRDDVLIAHTWQGQPLAREHGGPVRLVVPHLYFWKSAKWLRHITFMEKDQPGYWEARGYHMRGDPWKEERYD
ncbi:MAG: sulfite oxidase-like oxidoreductase [Rhodospirillaceae bacterium]|nr:MAG: sulfite oxidase-like oxidoreductase [Rhodospirillaceae bacterium]